MRKANTVAVDAQIAEAAAALNGICVAMAAADVNAREWFLPELYAATERLGRLNYERTEIIRTTFYRRGVA